MKLLFAQAGRAGTLDEVKRIKQDEPAVFTNMVLEFRTQHPLSSNYRFGFLIAHRCGVVLTEVGHARTRQVEICAF